jgi:hypothetical protein
MWIRFVVLMGLLFSATLAAGMHKCVDADGNVTYSQTACREPADVPPPVDGPGQSGDDPGAAFGDRREPKHGAQDMLCARVHDFALEMAEAMRQGVGVDEAVAIFGGCPDRSRFVDGYGRLSGTRGIVGDDALEVINHVFAYAGRGAAEPAQIAEAAARHCRRGRFELEPGAPGGAEGLRRRAGSGILLNPQGMVLTADRLIADCGGLRTFRGGAWRETRVLRRDPALDLAILLVDGLQGRPAVFTDADAPLAGTLVVASLPLRGVLTGQVDITEASVAAGDPTLPIPQETAGPEAGLADAPDGVWPLDLPAGPAQTGAPVLDDTGLIAGMVLSAAADDDAPRLVPTAALRRFLVHTDVAFYSAPGLGKLTRDELRRRAAGFTVHVECSP